MAQTKTRKRVVKVDTTRPALVIEDGKVIEVVQPEIEEEIEEVEEEVVDEKPKHRIQTPKGEAVYEYYADCVDCAAEGKKMPVFVCKSDPIRADDALGNQIAGFWNDGGGLSAPLCMKHYSLRLGLIPKPDISLEYKVLERTW
jgi:hypothetical protein